MKLTDKTRTIAIFGGTFDPFTPAHVDICRKILDLRSDNYRDKLIDKLYVVPTVVDYYRDDYERWLSDDQRVSVVKELLESSVHDDRICVYTRDIELRKMLGATSEIVLSRRFIDTLVDVCHDAGLRRGIDKVFVVVGADQLLEFKKWHKWNEICNIASLAVVSGRNGFDIPEDFDVPYDITIDIDPDYADMSASRMRATFTSVENYVACMKDSIAKKIDPSLLLHTPIFDVRKGDKDERTGLEPVLVNAPDWVTVIVRDTVNKKFLVERQFRYGSNCEIEEFPCGMVEPGENIRDAAIRELREETGYVIGENMVKYLGWTNPNPAFMTNKMHYFYVEVDGEPEKSECQLDSHEIIDVMWVDDNAFIWGVMGKVVNSRSDATSAVPAILLSAICLLETKAHILVGEELSIEQKFDEASEEFDNDEDYEEYPPQDGWTCSTTDGDRYED